MPEIIVNAALLAVGVIVLTLHPFVMWWCWTQVIDSHRGLNPAWTDGLPRWLQRRLAGRRTRRAVAGTASGPMVGCSQQLTSPAAPPESEQLALPPAPAEDAA